MIREIHYLIRQLEGVETTNDPDDRGGLTAFGLLHSEVTEKGYSWPIDFDFAVDFYLKYYYRNVRLAMLKSPLLRYRLLVDGVHIGSHRPIRFLQRVLNANNNRGVRWPDIAVDGLIGLQTAWALNSALEVTRPGTLDNEVRALTYNRYLDIVEADETQEKWFRGWKNRISKYPEHLASARTP